MKDFDIREIEFEEDDLPVEGDFEDIQDELHNLCFTVDEEGNEIPYFCQLSDIEMIYNLDDDEIIEIAYENGYKVYSVFNIDTEEETLVIAGESFGADEIKSVYEEMFEDESFEVDELEQEEDEEDLEEGAEGKKEPGIEYVIYSEDEENQKAPIVAIRSTRVEAVYYINKNNFKARDKDADRTEYLYCEPVPKGRFKVGDDFWGPFDDNWNLVENKTKTTHKNINDVIKQILK